MDRTSDLCCRIAGFACLGVLTFTLTAHAQSGSRAASPPPRQQPAAGSQSSSGSGLADDAPVGLQGYCPVCIVEMKQWVKGNPQIAAEFDGHKYYFPGAEQVAMFRQNPTKYLPALGGDDIVQYSRTGERVPGSLSQGVLHKGRNYFFASAANQQLFQANPVAYENADLALGGECIVCRVGMNQRVAGAPEFTAVHDGLRYQFPAAEQQAEFMKSPASYVGRQRGAPSAQSGSSTRMPVGASPQPGGSGSR